MSRKLPPVKNDNRILIICEGYEEYDYIKRLKDCEVWDKSISIEHKNAKSIDNIFAVYSYCYRSGTYKLVIVFCDTEKHPYEKFLALNKNINEFHGKKAASHVVFFANPCTLQIVLSHFEKVKLLTNSKSDNSTLVKKLTGVENYTASAPQRLAIMKKITAENYTVMKHNLSGLSDTYTVIPSSNALKLFNALESGDKVWIKGTMKKIEK